MVTKKLPLRSLFAIWLAKSSLTFLRISGRQGGALPGLLAEKIDPQILNHLAERCTGEIIFVCGTNGKTTTSRMIADGLPQPVIHNRSGSNLLRGHLSAFLSASTWSGHLKAKRAVLEVDEAVLPHLLLLIQPTHIVLHNLFRDQLDRYGEVDAIRTKWYRALEATLHSETTLIVNADDPSMYSISSELKHSRTIYYGLEDPAIYTNTNTSPVDVTTSPAGNQLQYAGYTISHLGIYTDPLSDFSRPTPQIAATQIKVDSNGLSQFTLQFFDQKVAVSLSLPGLYNIYNAVAAAALLVSLKRESVIASVLAKSRPIFGRFEQIKTPQGIFHLCLIKNPVGASEVLRTISAQEKQVTVLLACNDHFADGQDVSWYYDAAFEQLAPYITRLICSGTRAADIALRLKYAGVSQDKIEVIPSLLPAFTSIRQTEFEEVFILSTYTATLEIQTILRKKLGKKAYWKE